jgi:hypothetical protein
MEFGTLFPQGLMGKSMNLLEGLRSTMEGERELLLCFGCAQVRKKRQVPLGKEGERYIYTLQSPTVT